MLFSVFLRLCRFSRFHCRFPSNLLSIRIIQLITSRVQYINVNLVVGFQGLSFVKYYMEAVTLRGSQKFRKYTWESTSNRAFFLIKLLAVARQFY